MSDTQVVPFGDIERMSAVMGRGKMFGKSAEELLPLMLIAQAEHKHPAIAALEYDIIQGRPAINSKASLARFQSAGGKIQWLKRTDAEASAKLSHPQGGELTVTWTMDRAIQAGLAGKDNWKKYPAQMLSARVVAEGVRAVFPACLSGMYTVEEVQDFDIPPQRNVTPHDTGMYGIDDVRNVDAMRDVKPPVKETKPAEPPKVADAAAVKPKAEPVKDPRPYMAKSLCEEMGIAGDEKKQIWEECHGDLDEVLRYLEGRQLDEQGRKAAAKAEPKLELAEIF